MRKGLGILLSTAALWALTACGGSESTPSGCTDGDGDGYGFGSECTGAQDCDDSNSTIYPGAAEVCGNTVDEDCDGSDLSCTEQCEDADKDGYGKGSSCKGTDCDDDDAAVNPGATEACGNGKDDDCTGGDASCGACLDEDQDGYGQGDACTGPDCNDSDKNVHPGATEVCGNGKDDDCTGGDQACPENCTDADGDGYGQGPDCAGIDCNDNDKDVHPGATEVCGNGKDDDCMLGDAACPKQCTDVDLDGYGEGPDCQGPDCNDYDPNMNPGEEETCGNNKDDDCEGGDQPCTQECVDLDGDGFGTGAACQVKDCDDTKADVHPGATETCGNSIDEDCSGGDLPCEVTCTDGDGDGYGVGAGCLGADCNDADPAVHPGATEICGNTKDDDCIDGDLVCTKDCVDKDGDGYGQGTECTGADCDDTDAGIHPGATEVCGNGVDEDCAGGDKTCPQQDCTSDDDCGAEQVCDHKTGDCRGAYVWEWWAPQVWADTEASHPGDDLFTSIDFDGDWVGSNAGEHKDDFAKKAYAYYSFVKTDSHWYLGYYFYHPWRWSKWGMLGTEYENSLKGVLLVVRRDGSTYGKIELMETITEDTFFQYLPSVSSIYGAATEDGTLHFDGSGHHPIVYLHGEDHGAYGDAYVWNDVARWEEDGFPDEDGVVYEWGNVAEEPVSDNDPLVYYELVSLKEVVWPHRDEISAVDLFDEFGHFASDDGYQARSLAPWRMNDTSDPNRPHGEILWDPADFVRAHFAYGWGAFSFEYVYNPYAIRVDVNDLYIGYDSDPLTAGDPDPYLTLWLRDGSGYEFAALDIFYGFQNSWYTSEVAVGTTLDMHAELGRYYFYGIIHPDYDYFGVDCRDDDGGLNPADWLMDQSSTYYYSSLGADQWLDWGKADSYFSVYFPGVLP